MMRKLILRSSFPLGDVVLMTAAVRDLHRCYPGAFITDVRTPCGELWNYNPFLRHLDENDPEVETLEIGYPLINWSNTVPYHALHAYIDSLNEKLGLEIHGTEFKGDVYLSEAEKSAPSAVAELAGQEIPYWLIAAGGKFDVTIKWWDFDRYQAVVDHFRGKIQFGQVGGTGDYHPKIQGAIDLRGKTSIRQLLQLVYHAQGVLCGVTGLMHLAAAVEVKRGARAHRPCVVVAGGREPAHWEAYPGHQFIHTIGALNCCASGGCWKTRAVPLGDGDPRDKPENLCSQPVGNLPRCMDMISAGDVIRRIATYFDGGALRFLTPARARAAAAAIAATRLSAFDHAPLASHTARSALERAVHQLPKTPRRFHGRGIVICAGGVKYFTNAWVCLQMLRRCGCKLPIQLWHLGADELDEKMKSLVAPLSVTCIDAFSVREKHPARILRGWELKPYALLHSPFREVLLLDADNVPVADPECLFDTPEFKQTGALFWPDLDNVKLKPQAWQLCGLEPMEERAFETGQIVLDKRRHWRALALTLWFNEHSDFWYAHTWGDKETFHLAWRKLGAPFSMPKRSPDGPRQYDFKGRVLFQHRNTDKWSPLLTNRALPGFRFEKQCREYLEQLRNVWDMNIGGSALGTPSSCSALADRSKRSKLKLGAPSSSPGPVTLVTLYDRRMTEVGKITGHALQAYAQAQGYACVCHDQLLDPGRHPSWNKLLATRRVLRAQSEGWAMWVDADAIVLNRRVRVEDLIPPGADLVFASDHNGLCAGIFLARCCEWTSQFFDAVLFLGDLNHDPDGYGPKWEQNTIKHVLKHFAGFKERVAVLPPRTLNSSISSFQKGDFILHLGLMPNGNRVRLLREAQKWVVT